jgi:hypothetical protein
MASCDVDQRTTPLYQVIPFSRSPPVVQLPNANHRLLSNLLLELNPHPNGPFTIHVRPVVVHAVHGLSHGEQIRRGRDQDQACQYLTDPVIYHADLLLILI